MKKIILIGIVFSSLIMSAQDLISGGSNSWILHTPDDGRTLMNIVPKTNGNWDWDKGIEFFNDGKAFFRGLRTNGQITISPASNIDNNSPGITWVPNDDFLYDGKYIHHFGFGLHDFKDNSSSANGNNAYLSGYFGVDFFSNGKNRMRINHNGYIGIGTTKPDSKLTVKGKIHCEEVLVDLAVPADYVFEKYYTGVSSLKKSYKMPTLEELAAFTKENHHLPNVPSAKKIQEEGLKLKEMTNLLLQKIEELTLYTIEQEKRIKTLEGKLAEKK